MQATFSEVRYVRTTFGKSDNTPWICTGCARARHAHRPKQYARTFRSC